MGHTGVICVPNLGETRAATARRPSAFNDGDPAGACPHGAHEYARSLRQRALRAMRTRFASEGEPPASEIPPLTISAPALRLSIGVLRGVSGPHARPRRGRGPPARNIPPADGPQFGRPLPRLETARLAFAHKLRRGRRPHAIRAGRSQRPAVASRNYVSPRWARADRVAGRRVASARPEGPLRPPFHARGNRLPGLHTLPHESRPNRRGPPAPREQTGQCCADADGSTTRRVGGGPRRARRFDAGGMTRVITPGGAPL